MGKREQEGPIPEGADAIAYLLEFVGNQLYTTTDYEVWLTGSRARGNHRPDSDWDLVVVSSYARPLGGVPLMIQWTNQQTAAGDRRFDIVLLHPCDVDRNEDFIRDWRRNRKRLK